MEEAQETSEVRAPARIGRYVVHEPIGEGGMARVFLAQKDGATSVCVLKRLHVQLEQNSGAAKRFQREAHIASLLKHPNIADILDAGIEDGSFCIAMEFVAGETLERMLSASALRFGTLPIEVTVQIMSDALAALEYAHAMKDADDKSLELVHRDLSPRNIMVSYAGKVKVIDFGIARGNVDDFRTAPGVLMGTPYYMSPEQALTEPVDRRSDIYTLGAVLYEMLTGERLVKVKGRAQILLSVAKDPAPRASDANASVPKLLDEVLAKALEKNREQRYATAGEFRAALLEATRSIPLSQERTGKLVRELFPEGEERAARLIRQARRSGESEPPVEATRMQASTPPQAPIRGINTPTPLPKRMSAADMVAPTRTGVAAPRTMGSISGTVESLPFLDSGITTGQSSIRPRPMSQWILGIVALIVLGGLGTVLATLMRTPEDAPLSRPVAEPMRKNPAPVAVSSAPVPAVEPQPVPPEQHAGEPSHEHAARPRHNPHKSASPVPEKVEPAAVEKPEPPKPKRNATLHKLLKEIHDAPRDSAKWVAIHDVIEQEANHLEDQKLKDGIKAVNEALLNSFDETELKRIVRDLEKASAN
jgi:serine/threonine-protein kinase